MNGIKCNQVNIVNKAKYHAACLKSHQNKNKLWFTEVLGTSNLSKLAHFSSSTPALMAGACVQKG